MDRSHSKQNELVWLIDVVAGVNVVKRPKLTVSHLTLHLNLNRKSLFRYNER